MPSRIPWSTRMLPPKRPPSRREPDKSASGPGARCERAPRAEAPGSRAQRTSAQPPRPSPPARGREGAGPICAERGPRAAAAVRGILPKNVESDARRRPGPERRQNGPAEGRESRGRQILHQRSRPGEAERLRVPLAFPRKATDRAFGPILKRRAALRVIQGRLPAGKPGSPLRRRSPDAEIPAGNFHQVAVARYEMPSLADAYRDGEKDCQGTVRRSSGGNMHGGIGKGGECRAIQPPAGARKRPVTLLYHHPNRRRPPFEVFFRFFLDFSLQSCQDWRSSGGLLIEGTRWVDCEGT